MRTKRFLLSASISALIFFVAVHPQHVAAVPVSVFLRPPVETPLPNAEGQEEIGIDFFSVFDSLTTSIERRSQHGPTLLLSMFDYREYFQKREELVAIARIVFLLLP